tara:strand:+ start:76 stop:393 length:318 start_codon:yes stop_codon:yes gene_type:complete
MTCLDRQRAVGALAICVCIVLCAAWVLFSTPSAESAAPVPWEILALEKVADKTGPSILVVRILRPQTGIWYIYTGTYKATSIFVPDPPGSSDLLFAQQDETINIE